jgi:hypothetical protein
VLAGTGCQDLIHRITAYVRGHPTMKAYMKLERILHNVLRCLCSASFDPLGAMTAWLYIGFVDVEPWVSRPFKQLGLLLYGWSSCRRLASTGRVRGCIASCQARGAAYVGL